MSEDVMYAVAWRVDDLTAKGEFCDSFVIFTDHEKVEDYVRKSGQRYTKVTPLYAHPPQSRVAAEPVGLREAVEGIDDDYMTSEKHHPGYVLIPTGKFEQIVSAVGRAKEIVPPYYVNWHNDADKALVEPNLAQKTI